MGQGTPGRGVGLGNEKGAAWAEWGGVEGLHGGPAPPRQEAAELASWQAYGCFQVRPPCTHHLLAQVWAQALCSPALEDAPATQWVPGLKAAGTVRKLGTGCHGYPIHLDGQRGTDAVGAGTRVSCDPHSHPWGQASPAGQSGHRGGCHCCLLAGLG